MFNSITSFLFGSSETQNVEANLIEETEEPTATKLETKQTDGEWILVEKSDLIQEKRTRPHSSAGSRKRTHNSPNHTNLRCNFQERLCDDNGSSVDPYDSQSDSDLSTINYPMMEESWLVTPPACFTAGSSKMETSSMENLLIEHPSMSVYHHRGRQSSTGQESENSESSDDEESGAKSSKSNCRLMRHEPPLRPRAVAARTGLVQVKTIQSMQKAHRHQQHKNLAQSQLRRSNRVHSAQGKVVRRHLVQQPRPRMSITANNKY